MLWLFLFCSALCASSPDFSLLDRLERAKNGDFIVLEANKTITLLAIRSKTGHSIVLEEISSPAEALQKKPVNWGEWIKSHAPGHTSWSMMEIDLRERQILECYSFSRATWMALSQQNNLLATLLQLHLTPLDKSKQRRIGPPPQEGEKDQRALWNPPLVINGKKLENALFEVFEATWPQDGSQLEGKSVCLYFDRQSHFPIPHWIQIETEHATASVRAIDSGKSLPVIHRIFPRRIPEFIAPPLRTKNGIRLSIKSPKYYKEFELFAVDVTDKEKQIYPIAHSMTGQKNDQVDFDISMEDLNQTLQPDRKYKWLIVPSGHSESYIEFQKPFTWPLG